MEIIGDRIKELRNDKKLTQEEFGKIIGVSQEAVSCWEIGTRQPDIPTLRRIAQFFGVSSDYLIGLVDY